LVHFLLKVFSHPQGGVERFFSFAPECGTLIIVALDFCSPTFGSCTTDVAAIDGDAAGLFGVMLPSCRVFFHLLHGSDSEDVGEG
jgi:hypothetical protein